jgi:hypothetical protein
VDIKKSPGAEWLANRYLAMVMRRSLVLTDESARHPFRASLPSNWREFRHERAEPRVPWRMRLAADARGFAQAYVACFFAVTAFVI